MKTILKNGVYQRVSNEVGDSQVKYYGFEFAKKQDWKREVRDLGIVPKPTPEESKAASEIQLVKKPAYQKPKKS